MFFQAATSAAQPNSSPNALRVLILSCEVRNGGCLMPSSNVAVATRIEAAVGANSACRDAKGDLGISGACRLVSRPLLGITLRGLSGALRLGVALLRLRCPCGVSVPPRTSLKAAAKDAAQTSSGPRQESTPWHLGAGPTRSLR
jgi:hypothetical protein